MTKRLGWGLFFIAAAVMTIASGFGWMPQIGFFRLLLTVICAVVLVEGIKDVSWPGILFPIAFLYILYDDFFGFSSISPGPVLVAALFGSIGMDILFKKNRHSQNKKGGEFVENAENVYGDSIRMNTTFGGSTKYINTDEFERADISCTFGAMNVYLDNAMMKTGEATVDLDVSFAGVELYIPKTWDVRVSTRAAFGGVEQKNRPSGELGPVLYVTGDVNFGGVTIIYV